MEEGKNKPPISKHNKNKTDLNQSHDSNQISEENKDSKLFKQKSDLKNIYGFENLEYNKAKDFSPNIIKWYKNMPNALRNLTLDWESIHTDLSKEPELVSLAMEEPVRPNILDYSGATKKEEYELDKEVYIARVINYDKAKEIRKLEAKKYFHLIVGCQTTSSIDRCRIDPSFTKAWEDHDPISYLKIIRRTHLGTGEKTKVTLDNAKARFYTFKMMEYTSIEEYNTLFKEMSDASTITVGKSYEEEELVARYINSLNDKFTEFRNSYSNGFLPYPKTLKEAQEAALKYLPISMSRYPNSETIKSGYSIDSVINEPSGNKNKKINNNNNSIGESKYDCPYCLKFYNESLKHYAHQCPRLEEDSNSINSKTTTKKTSAAVFTESIENSILAVGFAVLNSNHESLNSNNIVSVKNLEILDPQSQISIFNDENKVANISQAENILELTGIGGGSLICTEIATHPIMENGVYFNKDAIINIWSMKQVEKYCDTWMVKEIDKNGIPYTSAYIAKHRKSGEEFKFIEYNGLYVLSTTINYVKLGTDNFHKQSTYLDYG